MHRLDVRLDLVLDLTDAAVLQGLGIGARDLSDVDLAACQRIGGVAASLGYQGMLVPSARHDGTNLVIFTANVAGRARVRVGRFNGPAAHTLAVPALAAGTYLLLCDVHPDMTAELVAS